MTRIPGQIATLLLLGAPLLAAMPAESPDRERPRTGDHVLATTLTDLLGKETAERVDAAIPADERVEWQLSVPDDYDASKPAGLLVYVSPTQSGRVPRGWKESLHRHNVIWLAANRAGNRELVVRRVLLATLGVTAVSRRYAIDAERVFISGLSGGGKTASMIATDYPQIFKGAIYNCGVELWDVETPQFIDQMRRNRFVFITGTHDQALEPTKEVYRAYRAAGIENSKLMIVRNMSHRNPGRYDFEEALSYLDAANDVSSTPE